MKNRSNIPPRFPLTGIGTKLFLSYLLVSAIGLLTLFLGVSFLAPTFFDRSMITMMSGPNAGMMAGMMGQDARGPLPLLAELASEVRQATQSSLFFASSAALVAAIAASYMFSGRIVAPLRRMARASGRIAAGQYAERVTVDGNDELAELAESFNQMAASLEETERRRLALIADVAHELRTPISTIEGYAEGLMDGVVDSSAEAFALLHREAGRLRRLVDDLQELSRAEAHQLVLNVRPISPKLVIAAAVDRLQSHFDEKAVSLDVASTEGMPEVSADEDRAVQVLTNLLANALRYTPSGGRVTLRLSRAAGHLRFEVSDSGMGIAPEHLPHLFERFYRVEPSRSRAAGGSGIGLTIAKHLVEAQGGTIRAESAGLGRGATFTFTLPIAGARVVNPTPPAR